MKGRRWKRCIAQDLLMVGKSPDSFDGQPKQVVIVMDGLKEFSMEPLEWVLKNIALLACCTITLLGVMPWLNIPLSSKTWSDIWTFDLEDPLTITSKSEWKSDPKYQKIQQLITICQKYGVVPQIKTEMGFPLRLLVVEQISSSCPTLVVFDRHQKKKNIKYYARKVPCNMIKMNVGGEMEMIKSCSHTDNSGNNIEGSTSSRAPTPSRAPKPELLLSEPLKNKLKLKAPQNLDWEMKIGNRTADNENTLTRPFHFKRSFSYYDARNQEDHLTSGTSKNRDLSYDNYVQAH